jgi:hypothetical protein
MRGMRVVYVSAPGFSGKDYVTFTMKFGNLLVHRKVEISVGGEGDFVLVERPPLGGDPLQKPGPLPRCTRLVS